MEQRWLWESAVPELVTKWVLKISDYSELPFTQTQLTNTEIIMLLVVLSWQDKGEVLSYKEVFMVPKTNIMGIPKQGIYNVYRFCSRLVFFRWNE